MQIILTHEQADFDAIGSLLGAHLLNERGTIPVKPRRLNRNVQAFINLYGIQLPFVDARDLTGDKIDTITLVDTQSLITLRGMSKSTRIQVVDHHQKREGLSEDWKLNIQRVGACTTLFVETLREHGSSLSVVHATLLLLGIYEDTGSLTYVGTTPRDLWAAAYLLEQGASLRIAAEYLNPPLSDGQRRLYDRLLASLKHHMIEGQEIVIACADARDMNEEISSVAHKMRDLLDLDALFVLVNTSEGLRLVCRSTSDNVDVSEVAAYFGGGGHERASAALIHSVSDRGAGGDDFEMKKICRELIGILPKYVHPSVTIAEIMSEQPMILSPQTSVREASRLMQRYGYEGYPVVDNRKVIGLLTRRAVDRALAHKLNLDASSLMEAGEVTVNPEDSLDYLQRVMTSSGWGQIPVVDPMQGDVIGIVTRTDLLKTITNKESRMPGRMNLASQLEAVLPSARLVLLQAIAAEAHQRHLGVYIVGGFVRDLILDCPSLDFDIVVEGDAISLGHALASRFGGRIVSHNRFGTAKWWIADHFEEIYDRLTDDGLEDAENLPQSLDLISARTEFYEYPTALPTVKRSSIKLDLHRRDFTINTMALRLDGRHYGDLFDYWGGLSDLRRGLVRVIHSLSFVDDPTRLLRAVRFEQRFGFVIENRTKHLMAEALPMLNQVSGDRLRHEISLILDENDAGDMLARLQDLGILLAIHQDLKWEKEWTQFITKDLLHAQIQKWELSESFANISVFRVLRYLIWLAKLPGGSIFSIGKRLHFPSELEEAVNSVQELLRDISGWKNMKPSYITARLDNKPMVVLCAVCCLRNDENTCEIIGQYINEWRKLKPVTDGNALRAMGIKPGPIYKEILSKLRCAWLDGGISTVDDEKALLEKLVQDQLRIDDRLT